MRKIREVLRLRYAVGLSARQVAASVQIAHSSVSEYERRLAAVGLSWPLPEGLSDTALERRLFPSPPPVPSETRPVPLTLFKLIRWGRPSSSVSTAATNGVLPRVPRPRL